jgi:hypothetical protein
MRSVSADESLSWLFVHIGAAHESTPPSLVVDVEIRTNARWCGTSRPAYEFIERRDRAPRARGPDERTWGRRTKADLDRLDREIALALRRR